MARIPTLALQTLAAVFVLVALGGQALLVSVLVRGAEAQRAGAPGPLVATLGILALAGGEVVLVATWALLARVRRGTIAQTRSLGWLAAVVVAASAAALLTAGAGLVGLGADDDANLAVRVAVLLPALGCGAVALLALVLRAVVLQALERPPG